MPTPLAPATCYLIVLIQNKQDVFVDFSLSMAQVSQVGTTDGFYTVNISHELNLVNF
jgi:hypothetical protein